MVLLEGHMALKSSMHMGVFFLIVPHKHYVICRLVSLKRQTSTPTKTDALREGQARILILEP